MLLEVHLGDEVRTIELDSASSGRDRIRMGDRAVDCDWRALGLGRYSILIDGSVYDLCVELDGGGCVVRGWKGALELSIIDPRRTGAPGDLEEKGSGLRRIVAEMPGKVVRILVAPGDTVVFGQGLLVLEAMKMQNEIPAPRRGTVLEVGITVGTAVGVGDFLLSLE